MQSTCEQCGSPVPSHRRFCGRDCRKAFSRVVTKCPACGKEFWYLKSWPRIYCSRECSASVNAKILFGIDELPPMHCEQCGKEIKHNKYKDKRFCSRRCFGDHLSVTQKGKDRPAARGPKPHCQNRVMLTCQRCGKTYEVKKSHEHRSKYCSKECTRNQVELKCEQCGKLHSVKAAEVKRTRFCSIICRNRWQSENMTGENASNWRGGYKKYYGPNWFEQRRAARKRDGYKCQCCGKTQKKNGAALDVHHIVAFRTFDYIPNENTNYLQANDLYNLISVCKKCHRKIEKGSLSFQLSLI